MFENDVEMYGAQATTGERTVLKLFENDVEMYGAQAIRQYVYSSTRFENDVEMYGAQAGNIVDRYSVPKFRKDTVCLRKQ